MLSVRFQNDQEMRKFLNIVKVHIGRESEISCLVTESLDVWNQEYERHVTHKVLDMLWDKITVSNVTIDEKEVLLSDITLGGQLGFFRKVGEHDFSLKKYDPVANFGVIQKFRAQQQLHEQLLKQIHDLTENVNRLTLKYSKSGDTIVNRYNEPESLCTPTVRSIMDTYLARHVSTTFLSGLTDSYMFSFTINCLPKKRPSFDDCSDYHENGYHAFKFHSRDKNSRGTILYELPLSKFTDINEVFKSNVNNTVCAIDDGFSNNIRVRLPTPVDLYSLKFNGDIVFNILNFDNTLINDEPYLLNKDNNTLDTLCSVSLIMEELNYQESIKVNRDKIGYYKIYEQMETFLQDRKDSMLKTTKGLTLIGYNDLLADVGSLKSLMENMSNGNNIEYDNTWPWTDKRLFFNLNKHNTTPNTRPLIINSDTLFDRNNHPLLCGSVPKQWMSKLAKMKEYSFIGDNPTLPIGILEVMHTRDDKKVVSLYPCKTCGRIWSCLTVRHLCEMLDLRYVTKDGDQYARGKQPGKYVNSWDNSYSTAKLIVLPKIDKTKLVDDFPKNQHKYMNDADVEKMRLGTLGSTVAVISSSISTLINTVDTTIRRNNKAFIDPEGIELEKIRLQKIISRKLTDYYEQARTQEGPISNEDMQAGVECVLVSFILRNLATYYTSFDIEYLSRNMLGLSSLFVTNKQRSRSTLVVGYGKHIYCEVVNIRECLETPKCCGTMSLRKLPTARLNGAVLRIHHASSLRLCNDSISTDSLYVCYLNKVNKQNVIQQVPSPISCELSHYISYDKLDDPGCTGITYEQLIDDDFSLSKMGWLPTVRLLLICPIFEDLTEFLDVLSKYVPFVWIQSNIRGLFRYRGQDYDLSEGKGGVFLMHLTNS